MRLKFWICISESMICIWQVFKYSVPFPVETNFVSFAKTRLLIFYRHTVALHFYDHRKQIIRSIFFEHSANVVNALFWSINCLKYAVLSYTTFLDIVFMEYIRFLEY
jgi:hypothetical protein